MTDTETNRPSEREAERLEDPVEVTAAPAASRRGWAPPRAGRKVALLAGLALLLGVALVLYAWGLAEIDLANTVIRAPQDGRLGEVGVRLGQYVTAGSQLTFLVPPVVSVSANFKEAQTARLAPGQPVRLRVDALDHVEIAVRIAPDRADPLYARLRPGMSVEARVDTRGAASPRSR